MTVRAKFVCQTVTRQKHWDRSKPEIQTIKLTPVTDGTPEDKGFWDATPSGSIELGTLNPAAGNYFELGEKYYIDFTKASA